MKRRENASERMACLCTISLAREVMKWNKQGSFLEMPLKPQCTLLWYHSIDMNTLQANVFAAKRTKYQEHGAMMFKEALAEDGCGVDDRKDGRHLANLVTSGEE